MAYPITNQSLLEVTVEGRLANQLVMNVFHYQMTAGPTADGEALAEEFLDWFETTILADYMANTSADVTEVFSYAQWILPVRYRYVTGPGGPFVGGDINASLPPNDQVSITLQGELAGRGNIGRKSLFGIPNNLVVDGRLTPAGITAYQGNADDFLLPFDAVGGEHFDPVIVGTATGGLYPVITNAFVQPTTRVERRRTVGLGA